MPTIPTNPKLLEAIEANAKARYPKRRGKGTTPQANKIISQQYAASGEGYTNSIKNVDPKKRDLKAEAKKREASKQARAKKKAKDTNTLYIKK
jgi:hypothetical protein